MIVNFLLIHTYFCNEKKGFKFISIDCVWIIADETNISPNKCTSYYKNSNIMNLSFYYSIGAHVTCI